MGGWFRGGGVDDGGECKLETLGQKAIEGRRGLNQWIVQEMGGGSSGGMWTWGGESPKGVAKELHLCNARPVLLVLVHLCTAHLSQNTPFPPPPSKSHKSPYPPTSNITCYTSVRVECVCVLIAGQVTPNPEPPLPPILGCYTYSNYCSSHTCVYSCEIS